MGGAPARVRRGTKYWVVCAGFLLGLAVSGLSAADYRASSITPPSVPREFRAAWIATVWNLDWPSSAGLSSAKQQAELIAILDRAAELHLNALLLQVRPSADAIYASQIEPWSQFLTGTMGRPPAPFYDPLSFAVAEAHKRGIELHAWFNPFRALVNTSNSATSNHISRTHPEMIRRYGTLALIDPGDPKARAYVQRVIMDVVRRYDIDGVHLDDYFYPYPSKSKSGARSEFADSESYNRNRREGMSRSEWRRENINSFVQSLHASIKSEKPWVKFGISPFGIWRPGVPSTIQADVDAYEDLAADGRKWLQNGWVDYLSPQLYWSIEPAKQSFPVLLRWWAEQNTRGRHLWPGLGTERIGPKRPASEIVNQIRLTRELGRSEGQVHWSMKALMKNQGGIASLLQRSVYAEPALVPAMPWIDRGSPAQPKIEVLEGGRRFLWNAPGEERVGQWLLQTRENGTWKTRILPGTQSAYAPESAPDVFAVTAIDRAGNASPPAVVAR